MLANGLFWQGELDQAEQLVRQILVEAVGEESMLDDQGFASLALADIAYERDDLAEADRRAARALDLARTRGNEMLLVQAAVRLATIHFARREADQAHELLTTLPADVQNPAYLWPALETQARLAIQAGVLQTALAWENRVGAEPSSWRNLQSEREAFTLARLHLARGKPAMAREALEGRADEAVRHGRVRSQVTALCLEALADHADGNRAVAARSLVEALRIGQASGFRRLFLDEGQPMAMLLHEVIPMLPNRILKVYATTLLHSFDPETAARPGAALIEPLSPQERRVLHFLAAGLSNTEIARELVVSTNTVKTQVKSIFRKLDVRSRDEARELARELKLV
jgi:LuxR family maltose regulon positive regulatory protein